MNIEKLREARKKKGYSQEDLANACEVSRQAVSRWENGSSIPDTENLLQISKILDVSIDYLLDNEQAVESKVKMKFDYEDFMEQEEKFSTYEFKSKTTLLGLPLVHIHYTRGMLYNRYAFTPRRKTRVAKGIIAIGDVAIGGIAIGMYSIGILSIGLFSLGLFTLAVGAVGLIFSLGILSVGILSVGILALGIYTLGILSFGLHIAAGVVAIGNYAFGVEAFGRTLAITFGENDEFIQTCAYSPEKIATLQQFVETTWIPYPLKFVVNLLNKCLN